MPVSKASPSISASFETIIKPDYGAAQRLAVAINQMRVSP
jgi:hypothetical protein